jgi:hypothetical protein
LVHSYEGMPLHPETLPQDDRELNEAMVQKHLRKSAPQSLRMLMACDLRVESSRERVPRCSRRWLKKAMGRAFW